MLKHLLTIVWYFKRPLFWGHAVSLALRKLIPSRDSQRNSELALTWARGRATPLKSALKLIGVAAPDIEEIPKLPQDVIDHAYSLAKGCPVKMGGPGDINLLYAVVILTGAERVVETGVAYGWSTLAILSGLKVLGNGRLVSIDMPYPKKNNEPWVGVVVNNALRDRWVLIREPDRWGIKKAISIFDGVVDVFHYDSDKSYVGRQYGYDLMWKSLRRGGIFISDDIQDNLAFRDFVLGRSCCFAVTECQGKYVGIILKP